MPHDRSAVTDYPVLDIVRDRWSPRAFADKPVPKDVLQSVLEAARWAASCNNSQPWRFILATRDQTAEYEKLQTCINDRNRRWTVQAPVLMVSLADQNLPNGRKSLHGWYDTGMAVAQMILQATHHGLCVHQMQGILYDRVREVYAVPDDFDVCAGIALGYRGEPDSLPEELPAREFEPRERRTIAEFTFGGAFGTSNPAIS